MYYPEIAKQYGDLHELAETMTKNGIKTYWSNGPKQTMDRNNNYWGIAYATKKGNSPDNFDLEFIQAVQNKEIIIIDKKSIPNLDKMIKDYKWMKSPEYKRVKLMMQNW